MSAWRTLPVHTPWLDESQDLDAVLQQFLPPLFRDDTIVISEKVAVLVTGGAIPIASVRVRPLARVLARTVRPRLGSRGLSVPEKMQYVIQTVGRPRIIGATLGSAVTRPFGRRGAFYRIAGDVARDLDGGRPPYEHLLIPPMPVHDATHLCESLQSTLGVGVAIVDINDFGGSIRATSGAALPAEALMGVLSDNPLGQRDSGTPFGIVRRMRSPRTGSERVVDADDADADQRMEPPAGAEQNATSSARGAVA